MWYSIYLQTLNCLSSLTISLSLFLFISLFLPPSLSLIKKWWITWLNPIIYTHMHVPQSNPVRLNNNVSILQQEMFNLYTHFRIWCCWSRLELVNTKVTSMFSPWAKQRGHITATNQFWWTGVRLGLGGKHLNIKRMHVLGLFYLDKEMHIPARWYLCISI